MSDEMTVGTVRRVRFVVVDPSDPRVPAGTREEYEGEWCSILLDTASGAVVGIDGGEPEDQTLGRDWSWVPDALNAVADECDRLRARVAELEEATSAAVDAWESSWDCSRDPGHPRMAKPMSDLAALAKGGE